MPYIVQRTIHVVPGLTLELRVPADTATAWAPSFPADERMARTAAADRAALEALTLLRTKAITSGRWRVTWTGMNSVMEPL
jgi:hypothetical protein